ncbi:hypothetical protein B0H67DRAFT_450594, partial [Lasiosphaeris hirsuta]
MDPSGDVLLTLNNANAPFAVWEHPAPEISDEPEVVPKPASSPVTFLLSSRHLSLASPVFKTMLSGVWSEGVNDVSDGLFRLDAEDWDSDALATVMNIVHGRWKPVPRTASVETLARIAAIVDYYDIREALQLVLSLWMHGSTASSVPTSLCRETVLWILVSWVFGDAEIFKQAAKVAILRSARDLECPGDVPIPSSIFDEINKRRRESMHILANELEDLRQGYIEGRDGYGCGFECSSIHLGALMRSLHGVKFLDRKPPDSPFGDLSLLAVMEQLRAIKSPAWAAA